MPVRVRPGAPVTYDDILMHLQVHELQFSCDLTPEGYRKEWSQFS